ncbi:lipase, partial [Bacillus haynesii]|nr:lipase [Bacillus haynesii]
MSKNIKVPNLSDSTYYSLSRNAYKYDQLKEKLKSNTPIVTENKIGWYVERVRNDDDTGLDAVVLSQAEKRNGKWVKSDNPKNVVVAFAGTDPGKDPLS